MVARALRIGSVSFVNARPLTYGLEDLVCEVPSRLTERFLAGELDVALLPTVEALRLRDCPVLSGMGISSPGPVDSVLLFARRPLSEARTVLLDPSSRTSSALARILFAEVVGARPAYAPCPPGVEPASADADAVLLIGDRALTASRTGLEVHDLAVMWREMTGLPFTFAVWVARDEESAGRAQELLTAAKRRGLDRREEIAREASGTLGLPEAALRVYLTERIRYDLGDEEQRAMQLFGSLLERHGLL